MPGFREILQGVVSVDPAASAVEYGGRWTSWGELARLVGALESRLGEIGVGPGGRVGVLLRNRPAQLGVLLGVIGGGQCLVTLNPLLPEDKLAGDLRDLKLPVVVGEAEDWARPGVCDALAAAGSAVIDLISDPAGARFLPGFERPRGDALRWHEPGVVVEMLTSGTTGTPKRVPLKTQSFQRSFDDAMFYERDRKPGDPPRLRDNTIIIANPLTHIGGLWTALSGIMSGRRLCLLDRFTVESWHQAVLRHRPKVAGVVPAALRMILNADIPRADLSSLVALRTGTAPLDPAIVNAFLARYDIPILENYGATEFGGAVAGWTIRDFRRYWQDKQGSAGRFHAGVEGRIIDPVTQAALPAGQEGVLEIRGAQLGDDAWVRTSDRARIDADGFLWVLGRADNAINRGGFKVHPDDVVKALEAHPAVREAVVVALADARLGEVPVAAVMLNAGVDISEAELSAFARAKLLPYQVPTQIRIVEDVPRTPSMKPSTPGVKELFKRSAA